MEQMFLSTALEFKEINTFEPGAWINLVNPSYKNLSNYLSNSILILQTFVRHSTLKKHHVLPLKMIIH